MSSDNRPIGVFDSGVGGLSVLNQLMQSFPQESFVYLGDTARLPYGSKSPATIKKYAEQNINYLLNKQNVKAVVIACNSASTVLKDISIKTHSPIFGVIVPGAKAAQKASKNKKIALWATRATVKQNSYELELKKLDPEIQCTSIPCPLIVPLVEEGLWEGDITNSILDLYLKDLITSNIDTLILGCTHYPFIKKALEKKILNLKLPIKIIDSSRAVTEELKMAFLSKAILPSLQKSPLKLLLTDEASHFMNLVLKTFPDWENINFQLIDIHQSV